MTLFTRLKFTLLLGILLLSLNAISQSFPSTSAPTDCNFQPIYNNISIENGEHISTCNSNNAVYGVNLNGGTLHVCSDITLTGNWNSGIIIVECGAEVTFPYGLLLNNGVGIINYGTVHVNGNLNFQNNENYFYNESDSSRLFVNGNLITAQNTNQTGYFRNKGYASISGTIQAKPGGFFSLEKGSKTICNSLQYMQNCSSPDNRFTNIETSGGAGILRINSSASLNTTFTNSNNIEVWLANGASTSTNSCGSWGNATVVYNAPSIPVMNKPLASSCLVPNCLTSEILPVELSNFDVECQHQGVLLNWLTVSERNNDYFEILVSEDGFSWLPIGKVQGKGNSQTEQNYSFYYPTNKSLYFRLDQYDFDGNIHKSPIRYSEPCNQNPFDIIVYPNPSNDKINIQFGTNTTQLQIVSLEGKVIKEINRKTESKIIKDIDISDLSKGSYFWW